MRKHYITKPQTHTRHAFSQPLHAYVNNTTFVLLQVIKRNWMRRNPPGIQRR